MAIQNDFLSKRKLLIDRFSALSENKLKNQKKWNAIEMAQHCFKIEKIAIDSILNFTGKRSKFSFKNWINSRLLLIFLRTNIKFKAPNKAIHPDETIDSTTLFQDWLELEASWQSVIDRFKSKKDLSIFFHPVAGKLNLKYTLLFILYHIEHHLRQLRKNS